MMFLNNILKYICSICLTIMVVIVVLNTILRYIFSTSIIQTEELCRYLFLWLIYMATITVWKEKGHICVTILTDHLSGNKEKVFKVFIGLSSLFTLIILAVGSFLYFNETTIIGQVTFIPYKVLILPLIITSAVCAIITVFDLYHDIKSAPSDMSPAEKQLKEQLAQSADSTDSNNNDVRS